MFNTEKLLGKIVGEIIGGSGKKGGIADSLTSGAGLMTIVGLGVGAMEIFKDQQQKKAASPPGTAPTPPPTPSTPPPPPGASAGSTPPVPPPPPGAQTQAQKPPAAVQGDELALRMIQVMIAAAHADGVMDDEEKATVLKKLDGARLEEEEKNFLLQEMDSPLTIEELTSGMEDPATCRSMYMLAVRAITIDTPQEREWMDRLAAELNLGTDIKDFIEEQQL